MIEETYRLGMRMRRLEFTEKKENQEFVPYDALD